MLVTEDRPVLDEDLAPELGEDCDLETDVCMLELRKTVAEDAVLERLPDLLAVDDARVLVP